MYDWFPIWWPSAFAISGQYFTYQEINWIHAILNLDQIILARPKRKHRASPLKGVHSLTDLFHLNNLDLE